MPYKVRAKLVGFMGDPERFPCHFPYEIGDEITFDGEKFEGRVCPGLSKTVIPDMLIMVNSGLEHFKRIMFKYHGGASVRDPNFQKYDGTGFRMSHQPPPERLKQFTPQPGAASTLSVCGDPLTLAAFRIEPIGLASGGFYRGEYMRQMSILEKIKESPGLTIDDILAKYNDFERNEVYPQLNPGIVKLMLEELEKINYIEMKDGKAYLKKQKED
jgi:uncharacterized repeat protein (TIGR04076 family)